MMITGIFCLIFYICHKNCPESIATNVTELTLFMLGLSLDLFLEGVGTIYVLDKLGFL